eukprot:11178757-Lingulodinium_polyedra.AAC.1
MPVARDFNHQGISIIHLCFDGALHGVFVCRFQQDILFGALDRRAEDQAAGKDSTRVYLTEWT